jgi:hypothetical protein
VGHRRSEEIEYELRLQLTPSHLELVSFTLDARVEIPSLQRGDAVAVIFGLRDRARDDLLSVINRTTGKSAVIRKPDARARREAAGLSAIVGVVAALVAGQLGAELPVVIASGSTSLALAFALIQRRLAPRFALARDERERHSAIQGLLEQKLGLLGERDRLRVARDERVALRARLAALQAKMRDVGLAMYEPRIASLDDALATIDAQLDLERQLLDGYEKSIKIIEIEYEAGTAEERLTEDVAPLIAQRLVELETLGERQRELERELAANAEVEQLLRRGGRANESR